MGKNWLDPAEIARDSRVYAAFVLFLAGMAAMDVIGTLSFDISIIRGKRTWRWPMLLYFITRICMIMHIFAFAVNMNAISQVPCQQVVWISKVADAIGTCCSSLILVLRTRAVWHRDLKVTVVLGALFCGQIAVWCQTFRYSVSRWNPERKVCAVIATAPRSLLVTVFAYTMAFDLIILLLCAYRLANNRYTNGLAAQLFRDGILYFVAAFGANLVQMVMASLALNPVMNIIALPFALVISVIAATTIFRNVFIRYDAFASKKPGSGSGNGSTARLGLGDTGMNRLASTTRLNVSSGNVRHVMTNEVPLGEYKNQFVSHPHYTHHDTEGISMHKVVGVDTEQQINAPPSFESTVEKSQAL